MADETTTADPPDWGAIAKQMLAAVLTQLPDLTVHKAIVNAQADGKATWLSIIHEAAVALATKSGSTIRALEEPFFPFIAAFTAPVVAGIFGAEVDPSTFARRITQGGGNAAAKSIVENFIRSIQGDVTAEISPTDAGARRIASAAVAASIESTFNAVATEMLSDILPEIGPHFATLTELPESILRTLGVGRLVRRALQPVVTTCCATPATWYMNKLHRPTLLGASTLAKQIVRNPALADVWKEDLRRDGYSEQRIEALLNEQAKFHSIADLDLLVRAGAWSAGQAVQHLRDQGYAQAVAETELQIEKLKRIATFERAMATAGVDAYVAGRITEGELGGFITGTTISPQEKAQYAELASARRICSLQPLTPSEAERCVKAKVLSLSDYRAALRRDGRTEDAITALDLLLRYELDKEAAIEQLRREQAEEREREKIARDAEREKRKREIEAQRALQRRGSEADLEAAAVRGLIPIARVQEVYAARYDGDTVQILSDDLAARRADYVAQQLAAEDARRRAAVRNIDVGALEQAVLQGVITVGDFRDRLTALKFSPADAALLADTLGARMTAIAAAQAAREHAAALAKIKHLDLGRMEALVRRGHRSLADYDHFLRDLDFDDGARAAMRELLQLRIDDDAAAAQLRADAAARAASKGLSVEQFRRAVIIGAKRIDDYPAFLLGNGFTVDAVSTLRAELDFDVEEAAAARARREEADRRSQAGRAPLSDVRRAARLGLLPVETYYARLRADGYTDDDVAIESDLLAAELAHAAALRADAEVKAAAAPAKGLTLAQLAAAVAAGAAGVADYHARAIAIGFSSEDAETLTRTLQESLNATAAARRRRAELAAQGADRELGRADVEKAVRKGLQTLDDYGAWLLTAGYTADDAGLLVAVLQAELAAGGGEDGGA